MPSFFPEGNLALPSDDCQRSLSKIVGLLGGANGIFTGGSGSVFTGHYGGNAPTQTPTGAAAIAYDLDSPFATWNWNGTAWF